MTAKIPTIVGLDKDWPSDIKKVIVFDKADKYRVKGRLHGLRSNAIRYFEDLNPQRAKLIYREAKKIIKRVGEMYLLGPNNSLLGGVELARKWGRKTGVIKNTFDLINDKHESGKELSTPELELLALADEMTKYYVKLIRPFLSSAVNIDNMDVKDAKKAADNGNTIQFKSGRSELYHLNFDDSILAITKLGRFKAMFRIKVNSPAEMREYWKKRIDDIESENFKAIISSFNNMLISKEKVEFADTKTDIRADVDDRLVPVASPLDTDIRKNIMADFEDELKDKGFEPTKRKIAGRLYVAGKNKNGEDVVKDWDGKLYSKSEFSEIVRQRSKIENRINNIHKIDVYLGTLEKVSDSQVDKLARRHEITYEVLSDHKPIQRKLARSYPCVEHDGRKLIVGGRFKGYYLEDMINRAGRHVAGSAYILDESGHARPMEYKQGKVTKFRVENEPYLTKLKNGQLRLMLPEWATDAKKRLEEVRKIYKTITPIGKSGLSFNISIEDFEVVNEVLGGLTMSEAVTNEISTQIENTRKLIEIESMKDFSDISTEAIPGMKTQTGDGRKIDFLAHQRKAIGIVDKKKGNTVIGLDTGTGKSIKNNTLCKIYKGGEAIDIEIGKLWDLFENKSTAVKFDELLEFANPGDEFHVISFDDKDQTFRKDKIVSMYRQKINEKIFKTKLKNGIVVETTAVHPFGVWRDGKIEFVPVQELSENDRLIIHYGSKNFTKSDPEFLTKDFSRVLSYSISEGCTNHGRISISQKNKRVLDELVSSIEKSEWKHLCTSYSIGKDNRINGTYHLNIYGKNIFDWFRKNNSFELKALSKNKDIPEYIMNASKDIQQTFLRAYFEAEGHVQVNRDVIEIVSASKKLIDKLQIMLLNFGIVSRIKEKKKSATNGKNIKRTYYSLYISSDFLRIFRNEIGFEGNRKNSLLEDICQKTMNSNVNKFPTCNIIKEFKNIIGQNLPMRTYFDIQSDYWKSKELTSVRLEKIIDKIKSLLDGRLVDILLDELNKPKSKFSPRNNNIKKQLKFIQQIDESKIELIINRLEFFIKNDIYFAEIESIKTYDYDGYVYDLCIENDHNYVLSNGLLIHNTLVGIGLIQKWITDGTLSLGGKNGKALIVTPSSLKGNFPAQARDFIKNYPEFKKHMDVISYGEFQKNPNKYKKYGAIFFDEAQNMRNLRAKVTKAALALNHPRKIPLTASVLEKSPVDLFVLSAIASNSYKNPKEFSKIMRKFVNTFCEKVEGKVIGLKENVETKEKFRRWVKRNTVYIDKAQPLYSKILTPNGWSTIGDIHIGDDIITPDGSIVKVIGEFNRGKKPIYKLTFSDGSQTHCCDQHLWLTKTKDSVHYSVKSLTDLMTNLEDNKGQSKHKIPLISKININNDELSIDPYLLGILLGDGSLKKDAISVTSKDSFIIEEISNRLDNTLILKKDGNIEFRIISNNDNFRNNNLLFEIRNLGLSEKKSFEKFIPSSFKISSYNNRLLLLQGLMDSDGYVNDNGSSVFVTTSKQLATDVVELVRSLGGVSKISSENQNKYTYKNEEKIGRISYKVYVNFGSSEDCFLLPRKKERLKNNSGKYHCRYLKSIELVGEDYAKCILVDHPDHLYITDDYIVTHNTDVKEIPLPSITPLEDQTESLQMPPEIKKRYNELTFPIRDTLQRMVEKYEQGELRTTEINQEISRVMGHLQKLKNFLNNSDDFVDGASNPKIDRLLEVADKMFQKNDSDKLLTFTDSPRLAEKATKALSTKIKHKKHVVGQANRISVYVNGEITESFTQSTKILDNDGKRIDKRNWQEFLINRFKKDRDVASFNLTKAYTTGHNIQTATTVVHLDRNSWNNENMKQRTARSWRTGQQHHVNVHILDLVNDEGTSLDVIQKYSMEIERKLFDEVIKQSVDTELKLDIDIEDVQGLIKNKEALRYMLNPTVDSAHSFENVEGE